MASRKTDKNTKSGPPEAAERDRLINAMIDNAPYYQNLKDAQGRFLFVNKLFESWIGLPKSEIIGKTLEQIGQQPVDPEKVEKIEQTILETGQSVETEARYFHRDGGGQDRILIKYPVYAETGEIQAVGSFGLDISERKKEQAAILEREELFRHAFDFAPIGMALVDLEGKRLRVNQALADFLGYSVEELIDTPMSATNGDAETLAKSLALRQRVIDGEISSYTNRRIYRHKQGHLVFGEVTASLVRGEAGEPLYFVAHTIDTTESERSRAELIEAKERAEMASQAKSEFQATMSHELRTPLTSLIGALGLLRGTSAGVLPEHAQTLLDVAQRNSQRLITLVNDLLDYEKITEGRLEFSLTPCDINLLVLKSVEMNQSYATEHASSFVYRQIPGRLFVDLEERRFEQIMSNLLSNAAKFSRGTSHVHITVTEQNGRVTIAVSDSGIGIPEREIDRIFDRFSQVDSTDSRTHGGTGLGLAITKALVEGMQGTIKVESRHGIGSTFSVSFPKSRGRQQRQTQGAMDGSR